MSTPWSACMLGTFRWRLPCQSLSLSPLMSPMDCPWWSLLCEIFLACHGPVGTLPRLPVEPFLLALVFCGCCLCLSLPSLSPCLLCVIPCLKDISRLPERALLSHLELVSILVSPPVAPFSMGLCVVAPPVICRCLASFVNHCCLVRCSLVGPDGPLCGNLMSMPRWVPLSCLVLSNALMSLPVELVSL